MKKRILAAALILTLLLPLVVVPVRSEDIPTFRLSFELYPRGSGPPNQGAPLEPAAGKSAVELTKGKEYIVAVKYDALSNIGYGVESVSVSFSYDSDRIQLLEFPTPAADEAVLWSAAGVATSAAWATAPLDKYTAHASDRAAETVYTPDGETTATEKARRVTLQYISEGSDGVRADANILRAESGFLGAFAFKATADIAEADNVFFAWSDYLIGVYSAASQTDPSYVTTYSKEQLAGKATAVNQKVATGAAEETTGVTVSGTIQSYIPVKSAKIYLFPQAESERITVRNRDRSIRFPDEYYMGQTEITQRNDMNMHINSFAVENVTPGIYTMVIIKDSHTDFIMRDFVIGAEDINLAEKNYRFVDYTNLESGREVVRNLCPVVLACGDANENGTVNEDDIQRILLQVNFGRDISTSQNPMADVNGNGVINEDDIQRVLLQVNFGKTSLDISFKDVIVNND